MQLSNFAFSDSWAWLNKNCSTVLRVFTVPYGLVVRSRILLYQRGWLRQNRLPCPVISVGNLTVGGTGKTPIVIWLANWLQSRGKQIGILSRGYGRNSRQDTLLVSNGREILVGPQMAGDEPFLIAQQCPGAIVAVGSDRYRLGKWVMDQIPVDCFILDDGFQHLGLYRDLNLLLVDASDEIGLHHLLPAGRLREPLSEAERATAIILTRAKLDGSFGQVLGPLEEATGKTVAPIVTDFRGQALLHVPTSRSEPLSWARGKPAVLFSGIGNHAAFRSMVSRLGVNIREELRFPDHFSYSQSDLNQIRSRKNSCGAEIVLTTEKDAVKIKPFALSDEKLWAVRLRVEIGLGKNRLESLLNSTALRTKREEVQ